MRTRKVAVVEKFTLTYIFPIKLARLERAAEGRPLCYNTPMNNIQRGQIRTNTKGVGYLRNSEIDGFIEIPNDRMNTALDLDLVEVKIIGKNKFGDLEGEVTKVIKRDKNVWVGVIREVALENHHGKEKTFIPDNKRFYPRTKIDNLKSFPRLKENEKVLVELVK